MSRLSLRSLRLLIAVERAGSIAEAARREDMAAAAISKRLADLETHFGVALLDRQVRGVTLTHAGATLVEEAELLLNMAERLERRLADQATGRRGEVRIAAVTSAILGRLPDVIASFGKDHPEVELSLREAFHQDALWLLEDGAIDMALVADHQVPRRLTRLPFAHDPIWIVGPPGHPIFADVAPETPIAFSKAIGFELIQVRSGGTIDQMVLAAASSLDQPLHQRYQMSRFDSVRRLATAGLGLGFLRESSTRPFLGADLDGRPLADDWAQRRLVAVVRDRLGLSPAADAFLGSLLEEPSD